MWRGCLKAALVSAFLKSGEEHCRIVRKPEQHVYALNKFALGKLSLVALSNTMQFVSCVEGGVPSVPSRAQVLYKCFTHNKKDYYAVVKPQSNFPASECDQKTGFFRQASEVFLAKYWLCEEDALNANCERSFIESKIKCGPIDGTIKIPVITNTKPINIGDALIVQKGALQTEDDAPAKKKARCESSKASSKGKSKGKGKGKQKKW